MEKFIKDVQVIKYTCGAGTPEEAETNCTYFIRGECTASFCEYRRKKQTNADRIRAMSDEELAEFIVRKVKDIHHQGMYEGALTAWFKWLKKPSE